MKKKKIDVILSLIVCLTLFTFSNLYSLLFVEFACIFAFRFAYELTQHGCKCVFIAGGNGKAQDGLSPAPAAPTVSRARLTLNQLVFHKVLGKGSFGKVGTVLPIFKPFAEMIM